jgi:tetratricopeptide (TPR) repeat protein
MPLIETPQQALKELREYIHKYIEELSQLRLAQELTKHSGKSVSESIVGMIERGERELQVHHVDALVTFLCNRPSPLIPISRKRDFRRDLLHGISVTHYLVDYIETRRRRATLPPPIEPAVLITNPSHLPTLIGKAYPFLFVGRNRQVEIIYTKLHTHHRVLISHFGGTGKTSVAAKVAEYYLQHHEDRSVVWLHAGVGTLEEIHQTLVQLLDPNRKKGDTLLKLLRDAQVGLLVLDDVWLDNLSELVLPFEIKLLVTSRRHLSFENQQPMKLDDLSDPDALELLVSSMSDSTDVDLQAAMGLCKQLGKHPLALRIAGASMSRGGRTPDEIAANLQAYVINNEKGAERTLDALIKQSFEAPGIHTQKDDLEQVFFSLGSLFFSTIPEDLLFDTLLHFDQNTISCLETLVELCLISRDKRRSFYSMHDLVYASAALNAPREVRERGLNAFVEYCDTHILNYDAIYQTTSNLLGFIHAHTTDPELVTSHALLELLQPLTEHGYFDARGYKAEIIGALKQGAQVAETLGQFRTSHYFWAKAGNGLTEYLRLYDEAINAYEEAGRLASRMRQTGQENKEGEAQYRHALSYSLVGKVYVRKREPRKAREYLDIAIGIAQQPDNPQALSQIYEHAVYLAGEGLNDIDQARTYALLSLQHAERITDDKLRQERRFFVMMNMGQIERVDADAARESGNAPVAVIKLDEALKRYDEAGQIANQQNNDDWKGRVEQEIGEVLFEQGKWREAIEHLKKAAAFFMKINSPRLEDTQTLIIWVIIYKLLIERR